MKQHEPVQVLGRGARGTITTVRDDATKVDKFVLYGPLGIRETLFPVVCGPMYFAPRTHRFEANVQQDDDGQHQTLISTRMDRASCNLHEFIRAHPAIPLHLIVRFVGQMIASVRDIHVGGLQLTPRILWDRLRKKNEKYALVYRYNY